MVSKAERKKQKQAKAAAWRQSAEGQAALPQPAKRRRPEPSTAAAVSPPPPEVHGGDAPAAPPPAATAAAAAPAGGTAKRKADSEAPAATAPPSERPSAKRPKVVAAELGQHEVYVKCLPNDSSEESIHEFFKESRPLGVKLGRDRQTNEFRGYAFLSFGSQHAADRCIEEWDGAWMGEQNVALSHAASNRTGAAVNSAGRGGGRGGRGGDRGGRGGGRGGDRGGRGGRGAKPTGNPNKADVWPGDWTCPSCGANVYGSLDVCYKPWCKEPKPAVAIETMTGEVLNAPPAAEVIAANKAMMAARVPTSVPCEPDASDEQRKARAEWLTRQISTFASQKQLAQAVEMYDSLVTEKLKPTVYTYSNLINAYVNSGDLRGANKAFNQLVGAGFSPNVVVFTTLLKGHAVSGDVERAELLFDTMAQQVPPVEPDLRFITTYLRGCLRVGDAPRASVAYQRMRDDWGVMPDAVAYKLVGRLLSQNLKLERLRALVQEAEQVAGGGTAAPQNAPLCMFWAKGKCDRGSNCAFWHDPSIVQLNASKTAIQDLDTKANLQLALAHAEAVLGNWDEAAAAIKLASTAQQQGVTAAEGADEERRQEEEGLEDGGVGSLFSHTARDEMGREIARVRDFVEAGRASGEGPPGLGGYLGRLFVFSSRLAAEEALDNDATEAGAEAESAAAAEEAEADGKNPASKEERKALKKARKKAKKEREEAARAASKGRAGQEQAQTKKSVAAVIVSALQRTCGLDAYTQREIAVEKAVTKHTKRCLSDEGKLKWKKVFIEDDDEDGAVAGGKRPVKLEICSGSGEWAAAQAVAEAGAARWVAMELRHDRVYDCFSRMLTGRLKNLAVIGGDASQVLRSYIADESVAQICVNFPEPPHRTGAGSETAENHNHLLTPTFFAEMHSSLIAGGGLTIFSDNYKYCKLLARTIATVRGEPQPSATGGMTPEVGERLFATRTPKAFNGSVSFVCLATQTRVTNGGPIHLYIERYCSCSCWYRQALPVAVADTPMRRVSLRQIAPCQIAPCISCACRWS